MKNVNKGGGCVHKLFRAISSPVERDNAGVIIIAKMQHRQKY